MKKILYIGNKKGIGKVFCKVIYKNNRLSISGVESPNKYGNCRGSCGQINPIYGVELATGWDFQMLKRFNEIWEKWHLNDLHAGCEHQRAMGWEEEGYDKHPSFPCPVCGYKYGTSWNFVEVPKDVIDFLKNLPDSKVKPAWV